ncbi:MAG: NAD(P)-dependent oxidoreductase [Rhodospirillales bacterium]|jgi:3-hydroxyisobutyrate dehydrogenase
MPKASIGVIGLGNMGYGITKNLAKNNVPLLAWDASPAARKKAEKLRGVTIAKPGEMAAQCFAIHFVVPATPQIEQCLKGKDGILAHAHKGLILCDHTSSDPVKTKKLAAKVAKQGIEFIDAAMSGGGAVGAEQGTISLLVGGDEKIFKKMQKYLKMFSKKIFYMGPIGAGQTMKLISNMVLHTTFVAACEGSRMAEKAGIPLEKAIDVFNAGNARCYVTEARFPNHILSKKWDARSIVYNLNKDVGMAVKLGDDLGVKPNVGRQASRFLKKAMKMGMANKDFSLLYRDFDKIQKM